MEVGHDYVCGLPESDGMSRCSNLPPFGYYRRDISDKSFVACNQTLGDYSAAAASPDTRWKVDSNGTTRPPCVDWNRYYSNCRADADNPFHGAVSFDDIGHAWIAIFQVLYNHCISYTVEVLHEKTASIL